MLRLKPLLIVPFFFAASVAAMSFSSLVKQAEVIRANAVTAVTSSTITVNTTIRGFAANDPYQIKNLSVSKNTFMNRVKTGMGETGGFKGLLKRNAWYAAWIAGMAAAGWAIDELRDQVTQPSGNGLKSYVWNPEHAPGLYFSTPEEGALYVCQYVRHYSNCSVSSVDTSTYAPNYSVKTSTEYGQVSEYMYRVGCASVFNSSSYSSCDANYKPVQDVSDDALYDSLMSKMLQDPAGAAQAFMGSDARVYPDVFPDNTPYIPGVAQSDEQALDWYLQGLAQSTNPNAPYYVAPDKLAAIAAQAAALQQAQSPEGQVAALNDAINEPLTQSDLEETLKKQEEAAAKDAETIAATDTSPITDAFEESGTKDEFDKLKERVTDPSKMPALPDLPSHTPCRTITVNIWNGVLTFPNPDQCQKLEQVKTGIGYLMYILTALGIIFELYRRVE